MNIYFVRHGDHVNSHLTELGKQQALLCSEYLEKDNHYSMIYSSPSSRCVETANIINDKLDLAIEILDDLNERENLPNLYPQNASEQEWWNNYMNPSFSFDFPEGAKEFFGRIKNVINYIFNKHKKYENIIIVAHSSVAYAIAFALSNNTSPLWFKIGHCSVINFELENLLS